MIPRLAAALDTIEERSAHLRGFIEGYAKFARLPMPAKQENAGSRWSTACGRCTRSRSRARRPTTPGHVRPGPDAAGR